MASVLLFLFSLANDLNIDVTRDFLAGMSWKVIDFTVSSHVS